MDEALASIEMSQQKPHPMKDIPQVLLPDNVDGKHDLPKESKELVIEKDNT